MLQVVNRFAALDLDGVQIAVIGDICIDHYYFIDSSLSEISVETGLETISVQRSEYSLGGAGNVAESLRTMGVKKVDLYGVVGDDVESLVFFSLCRKSGIGTEGVVTQKQCWHTNMYHKVIKEEKELPRFDLGNFNTISETTQEELLNRFVSHIRQYRCVIINEQLLKGLMTVGFAEQLNDVIASAPQKIFLVDTRHFVDKFHGVIYKINDKEALSYDKYASCVEEAARHLSLRWGEPLVITQGKDGALAVNKGKVHKAPGMDFTQPIDTVGAGDAFIASMAVALAGNMSFEDAVDIGNLGASASVLVLHRTGHPTLPDLKAITEEPLWRYHSEVASEQEPSQIVPDSQVEIIDVEKFATIHGYPKVAIFDNDGTISVLRQGWEIVMQEVMEDCIIDRGRPTEAIRKVIKEDVHRLIDMTTGIQTIIQMRMLVPLVKRYGLTEHILSPQQYKDIYLTALKKHMKQKMEALGRGELDPEDLTIKGSLKFLKELHDAHVELYLASGTDQGDVVKEATILGYAGLFGDKIRGSVGDPRNDPKKLVVEGIIADIGKRGIDPTQCTIFGDGPVEMREAHEHGFLAVGVLSDEKQRFGVNRDKRPRLILAGADVLIPDFSQVFHLYEGGGR